MKRGVRETWKRRLCILVCVLGGASLTLGLASCDWLFNRIPVAGFTISPSTGGTAPFTVNLTATATDPDNDDLEYSWAFNDGTAPGAGKSVSHKYMTAGTFTIVLTVTDEHGATDIATRDVFVVAAPPAGPTARITASRTSGTSPVAVVFDASGSSYTEAAITAYEWAFGDSITGVGSNVSHTFVTTTNRTYTVTLTVRAADGTSGNATTQIVVTGSGGSGGGGGTPTAGDPSAWFVLNRSVGVAPLEVEADPEDSEADEGRTLILYTWSFGDSVATSDVNPAVKIHVYTTDTSSETFSLMLLVLDNEGDNDSITKTVKAYNHRPVAGFEIINPPGGDTTANDIEYYVDAAAAEAAGVADPDLWVADDVVYGDLDVDSVGTPANIVVVIRSKQIPDERWRQLTNTDNQATLRTATTSATSSATPAVPTGYLSHNFSYDPEGQVWIDSPDDHVAPFWPDWFPNQAWGIRYLYIDWGDNTSQDQVVYADYADDYASGDVVVEHTYLDVDTAGGTVFEIGVTAEDWLGYRSAEFTRRVTLKAGYESSEAEI